MDNLKNSLHFFFVFNFQYNAKDVTIGISLSLIIFFAIVLIVQGRPLAQSTRTTGTLLNFVECDLWDGRPRIPFMPISLQSGTETAADVEITATVCRQRDERFPVASMCYTILLLSFSIYSLIVY